VRYHYSYDLLERRHCNVVPAKKKNVVRLKGSIKALYYGITALYSYDLLERRPCNVVPRYVVRLELY